jgi:hypothetical protein
MALNQALIAFKKLFNRPHTSNDKQLLANEGLFVGFQQDTSTIFAERPSPSPPGGSFQTNTGSFYTNDGVTEKIRLVLEFVSGTDTANGRHGFRAKLPPDYEVSSSNPKAGSGFFVNDQILQITTGSLQVVTPFVGGPGYEAILRDKNGTQIPLLDPREWIIYEFGGVVYQETPPSTGDIAENPGFLDCWIYIGDMASEISGSTVSGSGTPIETQVNDTSLTANTQLINISGSRASIVSASVSGGTDVTYVIDALQDDSRALVILADCGGPFERYVSGSFREITYVNKVFPSTKIWYADNSKSHKIIEKIITYNSNRTPNTIVWNVYEEDGITIRTTATDIIAYDSGSILETSRTRTIA